MSIISIVKAAIIKEKTMIDHWFELDERLRFITMASLNMVSLLFTLTKSLFLTPKATTCKNTSKA